MSAEREELYDMSRSVIDGELGIWVNGSDIDNTADALSYAILAAGYRKIFDGDCGLSNAAPDERDAAEAWMRWANILNTSPDEERNGIAAMQQMLTELGYRKPRTVTTVEELDALGHGSVIRSEYRHYWVAHKEDGLGSDQGWAVAGGGAITSRELASWLPAIVLHEGAPNV